MAGTGAANLLRDFCDDYTFNNGVEDAGDTVLINARNARDEEIQEDLDTNPGFVIFDRLLSVGEERALEILDMAVAAGLDGRIIVVANINGNVEPNMVSEEFLSRFESDGYSGIIEYNPEFDDEDYDDLDESRAGAIARANSAHYNEIIHNGWGNIGLSRGKGKMWESLSEKRKKAINESKTNTNKNMDLKNRSRRLSLNERFDDDETSVKNTRPTHDQLLEQVLELKKNSYPDGKYDGNRFVKSVLNLLHESGLSTIDVRKDPEYADIFVEQLFNTVSLEETYNYFKKGDEDHLDEAEKAPKSENGNKSVEGKKLKEYKLVELKDLLQAKKDALKELKKQLKAAEKAGKGAEKVQKLIDKVNAEIEMIKSEIAFRKANKMNESVRGNFNKYAKIYESEDISEGDEDKDDADDKADDAEADADDKKDDADADDKKDDEKDSDTKDNDVPMTAVLVKVAKDDVDKAKKQMIDAGVEEDDIDVVEGDEDADEVEIKVDANSIMALKDWLDTKGIDLEEKLGGEIVPPDEDSDSADDADADTNDSQGDEGDEGDSLDLDNMNFDDIFGDEKE